jgi:hypothetical protein
MYTYINICLLLQKPSQSASQLFFSYFLTAQCACMMLAYPQRNSGAQNKQAPTTIKGTSEWNEQAICRCGFFSPL